jgi:hypothetical protein
MIISNNKDKDGIINNKDSNKMVNKGVSKAGIMAHKDNKVGMGNKVNKDNRDGITVPKDNKGKDGIICSKVNKDNRDGIMERAMEKDMVKVVEVKVVATVVVNIKGEKENID